MQSIQFRKTSGCEVKIAVLHSYFSSMQRTRMLCFNSVIITNQLRNCVKIEKLCKHTISFF